MLLSLLAIPILVLAGYGAWILGTDCQCMQKADPPAVTQDIRDHKR